MQFLKTLFWVVIAVAAAVFAMRNWNPVTVSLWSGLEVDAKLPVLLLIAFLIGLLPTLAMHRAMRWSLRRRLESSERALAEARGSIGAAVPDPATIDSPARS